MKESSNGECRVTGGTSIKSENEPDVGTTKIVGIYGLRCQTTDKWYIGQSWDIYDRWHKAYHLMQCRRQPKIYNALKKYGYADFDIRIIEMCDATTPQDVLDQKETSWIQHLNSIENGYNLKEGGSRGKHSLVSREKMRKSQQGKTTSQVVIEKIRKTMTGKKRSLEFGQKISLRQLGRTLDDTTKHRISAARTGQRDSNKTREKKRTGHLGKKLSDTHRESIQKARLLFRKKVVVCDANGKTIDVVGGVSETALKYGLTRQMLSHYLSGRRSQKRRTTTFRFFG